MDRRERCSTGLSKREKTSTGSSRDWVLRFNEVGPDGAIDRKAPGPASKLNDEPRLALKEIVEAGPTPPAPGVVRWRLCDLAQRLHEEFGVSLDETTAWREWKASPVENIWRRLCGDYLSSRVLSCYTAIVDICAQAWSRPDNHPSRIMAIGNRDWANQW